MTEDRMTPLRERMIEDTDLVQTRWHAFPIDSAESAAASSLSGFSNAGRTRADRKHLDAARIEKP